MHRLTVWYPEQPGSPFDFPDWHQIVAWLHSELQGRIQDGDHLVVIEHKSLVGLPWHLALAPRWRCSYMPGWVSMLDESGIRPGDTSHVGIFAVPRYGDSSIVRQAISDTVAALRNWADVLATLRAWKMNKPIARPSKG